MYKTVACTCATCAKQKEGKRNTLILVDDEEGVNLRVYDAANHQSASIIMDETRALQLASTLLRAFQN